ncbi:cytidylate kinase family protein [Hyphomicrobium sp.]|uniref:cytidylate kinase family protein n=1 Tax=Hyphomicrobium sp. TaxID=82 RepID=UPI002C48F588|nr:cytidylate kinase family protein [Hyphomicrobium sp.]HRN88457.1 cytidylate kinase family protein [Hyphomicrobium sp.]HRQ25582.1 cytidylate kinase family protein [Hyphomicrobium sp.]
MAVIALTREMGTRGSEVAQGVAERLGLTVIHQELVENDVAQRTGLDRNDVHRLLQGEASLWERWMVDSRRIVQTTALEVLELALRGHIVIRGWGAAYLLRDIPHVVCVRTCAPMSYRERVVMERQGLPDLSAARREIERHDFAHNGTMEQMFGIDWSDPTLYSLVLNTARMPISACVDQIVRMTELPTFQETEHSRTALLDRTILARAQQAMDQRFGSRSLQNGFEISVFGGKVLLTGGSTDEHMIVEAIRLLQGVDGVQGVESKVHHVAFVPPA